MKTERAISGTSAATYKVVEQHWNLKSRILDWQPELLVSLVRQTPTITAATKNVNKRRLNFFCSSCRKSFLLARANKRKRKLQVTNSNNNINNNIHDDDDNDDDDGDKVFSFIVVSTHRWFFRWFDFWLRVPLEAFFRNFQHLQNVFPCKPEQSIFYSFSRFFHSFWAKSLIF